MKAWKTRVGSNLAAVLVVMTMTASASPPRWYTLSGGTRQSNAPGQCGPSWSAVTSPNVGTHNNELLATSATSSTDVWAVGDYRDDAGLAHPLALHWDGQAWSVVFTPEVSGVSNYLTAVNARSPDDAWAVGYDVNEVPPGGPDRTLTEHWDGT